MFKKITDSIKTKFLYICSISIFYNFSYYNSLIAATKNTGVENVTVNLLTVGGLILFLINGYVALLVSKMSSERIAGDEKLEQKIIILEKTIEDNKKDLGEAFSRLRDLETIIAVMKAEHDINHMRGKKNG